jgi:hypothetical protein
VTKEEWTWEKLGGRSAQTSNLNPQQPIQPTRLNEWETVDHRKKGQQRQTTLIQHRTHTSPTQFPQSSQAMWDAFGTPPSSQTQEDNPHGFITARQHHQQEHHTLPSPQATSPTAQPQVVTEERGGPEESRNVLVNRISPPTNE